ncbi:MAG: pyridoxamine 5'-phosphate oxidase [Acidobacteria bacterium RIFCSPLOWO2_12_FULL_67_14b]|nr:MAG: pyridoxamine 5'-phosphate oxidase [Acidobacteria bacterium RIFCSPLOWO2_12_FULL_67_14b]
MSDIAGLRRDYGRAQLRLEDLDPDPFMQFKRWLDEALSAHLVDANAMSLATANTAGEPSLRTVLLKAYSEDGFVFFTNLQSTKSQQIAENPSVALLFYWREFERQVTIAGTASRLPMADVARYFFSRPRESRVAAWVSPQSRVIDARQMLEMKFDEMLKKFGDGEIPVPSFWGGFRVAPRTIEFWQGGTHRLHDRFRYQPDGKGWRIECLAP